MRQFYALFNSSEFLAQVVRELAASVPWGHHIELMNKVKNEAERLYYLRATAKFGWMFVPRAEAEQRQGLHLMISLGLANR